MQVGDYVENIAAQIQPFEGEAVVFYVFEPPINALPKYLGKAKNIRPGFYDVVIEKEL